MLLVVHIMLQGHLATRELGSKWNAGRATMHRSRRGAARRAERASANFRETYPAFVALAAAAGLMGITSGWALIGAYVWFACRIVYIPLYLAGVPYVRSLVWLGSLVGPPDDVHRHRFRLDSRSAARRRSTGTRHRCIPISSNSHR